MWWWAKGSARRNVPHGCVCVGKGEWDGSWQGGQWWEGATGTGGVGVGEMFRGGRGGGWGDGARPNEHAVDAVSEMLDARS